MPPTCKPGARRQPGLIVAGAMLVKTACIFAAGPSDRRLRRRPLPAGSIRSTAPLDPRRRLQPPAARGLALPALPGAGLHWSLVTPVDESTLTEDERRFAHQHLNFPSP